MQKFTFDEMLEGLARNLKFTRPGFATGQFVFGVPGQIEGAMPPPVADEAQMPVWERKRRRSGVRVSEVKLWTRIMDGAASPFEPTTEDTDCQNWIIFT